jgi:hypothetical protein
MSLFDVAINTEGSSSKPSAAARHEQPSWHVQRGGMLGAGLTFACCICP